MSGEIPTGAVGTRVDVQSAKGRVMVRKLRRSEKGAALQMAGVDGANHGAYAKFQELVVRMSITGGEGLTFDGQPVEVKPVSHPVLGRLVSVDVYDALDQEDLVPIMKIAAPDGLDAGLAKN